jgi:hypothetical protein
MNGCENVKTLTGDTPTSIGESFFANSGNNLETFKMTTSTNYDIGANMFSHGGNNLKFLNLANVDNLGAYFCD